MIECDDESFWGVSGDGGPMKLKRLKRDEGAWPLFAGYIQKNRCGTARYTTLHISSILRNVSLVITPK